MKKYMALLLAVLFIAGVFTGCGSKASSSTAPSTASSKASSASSSAVSSKASSAASSAASSKASSASSGAASSSAKIDPSKYTFTYATCNLNHPVLRIIESGFAAACKKLGYKYQIVGTQGTDANDMNAAAEAAAAAGSKVILLMAETKTSLATIDTLAKDYGCIVGVPHVHWDEGSAAGLKFCCACDPKSYGKAVADFMAERLEGKKGTIAVAESRYNEIEDAAANSFISRVKEIQSGGKLQNVKVLDPAVEGCTDVTESTDVDASIIQANPDIIGAFSTTGNGPVTWSNAARKCGLKAGDICIISMDYTADNLAELEAGYVTAIVAQPLYQESYEAANYFDKLVRGEKVNYWNELEAPLVYKGGKDTHDPATYKTILDSVNSTLGS